jgi:hypothetical protein
MDTKDPSTADHPVSIFKSNCRRETDVNSAYSNLSKNNKNQNKNQNENQNKNQNINKIQKQVHFSSQLHIKYFEPEAYPTIASVSSSCINLLNSSQNKNKNSTYSYLPIQIHPQAFLSGIDKFVLIIVDTGASLCITHDEQDFVSGIQ